MYVCFLHIHTTENEHTDDGNNSTQGWVRWAARSTNSEVTICEVLRRQYNNHARSRRQKIVADLLHVTLQALQSKLVYFMRTKPGVDISSNQANDGHIHFAVMHSPLQTMSARMTQIYKPMFTTNQKWGKCSTPQVKQFFESLEKYSYAIADCIKTINTGLKLERPERQYQLTADNWDSQASRCVGWWRSFLHVKINGRCAVLCGLTLPRKCPPNPRLSLNPFSPCSPRTVMYYNGLLGRWCTQTEAFLKESDERQWDDADVGPASEIEFWRRRLRRLNSVIEQVCSGFPNPACSLICCISSC